MQTQREIKVRIHADNVEAAARRQLEAGMLHGRGLYGLLVVWVTITGKHGSGNCPMNRSSNRLIPPRLTSDFQHPLAAHPLEISRPQPSDTRVHRGVRNAAGALDGLGLRMGSLLRRYPLVRMFAVVYVVCGDGVLCNTSCVSAGGTCVGTLRISCLEQSCGYGGYSTLM